MLHLISQLYQSAQPPTDTIITIARILTTPVTAWLIATGRMAYNNNI